MSYTSRSTFGILGIELSHLVAVNRTRKNVDWNNQYEMTKKKMANKKESCKGYIIIYNNNSMLLIIIACAYFFSPLVVVKILFRLCWIQFKRYGRWMNVEITIRTSSSPLCSRRLEDGKCKLYERLRNVLYPLELSQMSHSKCF